MGYIRTYQKDVFSMTQQDEYPKPKRKWRKINEANKGLNFIDRGLHPENYPKLSQDGKDVTHKLSAEVDERGEWWVFPTVVYDKKTNQLNDLSPADGEFPRKAWDYAKQTGERISFGNDKESAIAYSENGLINHKSGFFNMVMGNRRKSDKKQFTTLADPSLFKMAKTELKPKPVSLDISGRRTNMDDAVSSVRAVNQYDAVIKKAKEYQESMKKEYLEKKKTWPYITDTRTINPVTGKPINPKSELFSDNYNPEGIAELFKSAGKYGVDPWEVVAIAMQETKIKNATYGRGGYAQLTGQAVTQLGKDRPKNQYDDIAAYLKWVNNHYKEAYKLHNKEFPPEEETIRRLQYYNGLGVLTPSTEEDYHGGKTASFYGQEVTHENPLRMLDNPAYGKTIQSIVEVLKNDKNVLEIYKNVFNNNSK